MKVLPLLLFLCVGSVTLQAKPPLPPWKVPSTKTLIAEIGPPPAPDSAEAKQDLATVLRMQAATTPAQIAIAKWDYNLSVFTFSEVLGQDFTAEHYPQTAKFFQGLNDLVASENTPLKNFFKRPHPYQVDPHVRQIVVAIPGYSYPSYHSARCVVFSQVLATLDPKLKPLFDEVAEQVEEDRVMAGEHFPSDIRAGRKLGALIYAALEKDPNFLAALHELKTAEWTPPPARAEHVRISIPKE